MKSLLLLLLLAAPARAIVGDGIISGGNAGGGSGGGATNLTGPVTSVGAATTIVGPIGINGLITTNSGVGVSTAAPVWPLTVISTVSIGPNKEGANTNQPVTGMFWTQNALVNAFIVRATTDSTVQAAAAGTAQIVMESVGNSPTSVMNFQRSSGTWSNRTQVGSADAVIGRLSFDGWTSGTTYSALGRLAVLTEGVPGSASNMPAYIQFLTASTGTVSATEKIRIESNGGLRLFVRTKAQIDGMTPNQLGSEIKCSDCAVPYDTCTATGTTLSGYRATMNSILNTTIPGTIVLKGCGTNN